MFPRMHGIVSQIAPAGEPAPGGGPDGTEYYVTLTVQSSEVDAALTDFPVFVDLSSLPAGFWTNVQADGGDIRVTENDGTTRCPVDLADIDTTGETGELHFLAGSLSASTNTVFRIYYGKTGGGLSQPAVTATYGRNAVWTSYEAVYHMDDDPSGTAPQLTDATGNGFSGTTKGSMPSSALVAGKLPGDALAFDGSNDYIEIDDESLGETAAGTYSIWAYRTGNLSSTCGLVSDRNNGINTNYTQLSARPSDDPAGAHKILAIIHDGTNTRVLNSTSALPLNSWAHVAFTWSSASTNVYFDGASQDSDSGAAAAPNNSQKVTIGHYFNTSQARYFLGRIDEVRVSASALSADWLAAEYSNQNTPSTFYTVGTQQTA